MPSGRSPKADKNPNIGEICEIQLNDPVFFSSGLLKIGRTLYVNTYRGTYAFDARVLTNHR